MGTPAGVPQYAQPPLAPFAGGQSVPTAAMPAGAGMPGTSPVGAGPVGPADSAQAPAAGGSAGGSGGPMMAAPMAAGQPMAPYSTPGAGSVGSISPTAAAAASSAPQPSAASASGVPPLVASTGGAATSGAMATASSEQDAHIIAARAVLEGLVRGTEAARLRSPVAWAVAVLEAAAVQHIVVASSVGDGGYLPATVFLPVGVRLTVHDPVLPRGWAGDRFVGWQRPTSVIEAHYEALTHATVYGPRVLATVTTEFWPRRPRCGGAFLALTDREILHRPGSAPQLDAAHCHRLSVTDQQLAARLAAAIQTVPGEQRAQRCRDLSVAVTERVLEAAAESDDTGQRLCLPIDEQLWAKVKAGTATAEDWTTWSEESDQVRDLPAIYAPQDLDDSETSRAARMWYRHHYRAERIAELLGCLWPDAGLGLLDAAYCGLMGGFGGAVATAIADVEHGQK
ncbi:MAG TPA: hypothetical protein VMU34_24050 [Mycobacterium sp.]|nr:hypothetical protein [Mycobacterium sp.]